MNALGLGWGSHGEAFKGFPVQGLVQVCAVVTMPVVISTRQVTDISRDHDTMSGVAPLNAQSDHRCTV